MHGVNTSHGFVSISWASCSHLIWLPHLLRSTAAYTLTISHGNNYFKRKKHALFFHGDLLRFAAI